MASDRLFRVSWEAGSIDVHVSRETEGRHVATEYMLAKDLIKVEELEREPQTEK